MKYKVKCRVGASTSTQYLGTSTLKMFKYKYRVLRNVQLGTTQVAYIANVLGYNYQVPSTNV